MSNRQQFLAIGLGERGGGVCRENKEKSKECVQGVETTFSRALWLTATRP